MARFHSLLLHFFTFFLFFNITPLSSSSIESDFSITNLDLESVWIHQDYSPPAPPPPPPHAPSVSCTDDLGGVGSLDSTCKIVADFNLPRDVYIAGKGNLYILPGVRFHCPILGCSVTLNISGNFSLGENSSIATGNFELEVYNAIFLNGSTVNTTGWAGDPPPQTSGIPQGIDGADGGHGGRGASCLVEDGKLSEEEWGGDAYAWSSLQNPSSYGSKGGSTSKEVDYSGRGGGVVKLVIKELLDVNGSLLAEGGDGGSKGGGGSIYMKAQVGHQINST